MTREEAIAYGNDYYRDLITACCEIDEKHKEFVRMSLEALDPELKIDAIPVSKFNLGDNVVYGTDGKLYKITVSSGKEYKQEPCGDEELVSVRQELLDRGDEVVSFRQLVERFEEVEEEYKGVPWDLRQIYNNFNILIGEEPCEDAISRAYIEPIIEELENICVNGDEHILDLLAIIKNAPSVTPQPKMGCEGCIYEKTGNNSTYPCSHCGRCYTDKYKRM